MPSSQTNFSWWVSLDNVVTSSSPRALLASSQRWPPSVGGVPPLGFGFMAVGEEAVGISSREASPCQCHLGCLPGMMCPLAQGNLPVWWVEVWAAPQDLVSLGWNSVMHVQMCLTLPRIGAPSLPWSCWPLSLPLVEEPWWDLALGWRRSDCQGVALWVLALPWWIAGCPLLGKWVCLQAGLCLWPVTWVGRLSRGPHTHSALLGRQPESSSWGVGGPPVGWPFCRWHCWCLLPLGGSDAPL